MEMKKRKLKKWVKVVITITGGLIVFITCCNLLSLLEKAERDRAVSEGRYEIHYTSTGDKYYK